MSEMRYAKIGEIDFPLSSKQSEMLKAMKEPHSGFFVGTKARGLNQAKRWWMSLKFFGIVGIPNTSVCQSIPYLARC